jgi:hypothetical protein
VSFRGNQGAAGTGSNGNAGPLSNTGFAVDPAAESLKKQQIAYIEWAKKQTENAIRQIESQG